MIFLEEPISQFQFSIRADFVSLILICPSTCLMWLKSLRFKFLIDLLKKQSRNFSFPISSPQLLRQLHTISGEPSSLLERPSQVSVQGFCGDFSLSLNGWTTFVIAISLPFWLGSEVSWNNRFSIPTHNPPSVSRGYYLKILTLWELCLLRYVCCWWDAPECWNPSHSSVAHQIPVVVREVDRRVLLVHSSFM